MKWKMFLYPVFPCDISLGEIQAKMNEDLEFRVNSFLNEVREIKLPIEGAAPEFEAFALRWIRIKLKEIIKIEGALFIFYEEEYSHEPT